MDNVIRRINIHVGERNWYRYGCLRGSLVDHRLQMPYSLFQACNFQISVSKRYDFSFIVFAEIGDRRSAGSFS